MNGVLFIVCSPAMTKRKGCGHSWEKGLRSGKENDDHSHGRSGAVVRGPTAVVSPSLSLTFPGLRRCSTIEISFASYATWDWPRGAGSLSMPDWLPWEKSPEAPRPC